jgi:hypothetical protein
MLDDGLDMPVLAYPSLGGGWSALPLDMLALDELRLQPSLNGPALVDAVLGRLARSGRRLRQDDGQPLTDPAVSRARATEVMTGFTEQRLPIMRQLGVTTEAG